MANKIYSNYSQHNAGDNEELIIETGNAYLACMVVNRDHNKVASLEWFHFEKSALQNFETLMNAIRQNSVLLDKDYNKTNIFINNGNHVIIPTQLYSNESREDYLNLVAGTPVNNTSFVDEDLNNAQMMLAYRVPTQLVHNLNNYFPGASVQHTFSQLLTKMLNQYKNGLVMAVQFYDNEFLVTVINNGNLQLVQLFNFTLGDDVLYNLLNLVQRLQLNMDELQVIVSGFIDTHADLYQQMSRFFKNIATSNIGDNTALYNTGDQPLHYFTQLHNLAI